MTSDHRVTVYRVTVYWDALRLVKGEDWEAGFAMGLLSSLCVFALLYHGATAPLAALSVWRGNGRSPGEGVGRGAW